MTQTAQSRAVANHRKRLGKRGISRYEVLGLATDKELVRKLARRLAQGGATAAGLRAEVALRVAEEQPRRGGIFAALRRSPLVGANLRLRRETTHGRPLVF